MLYTLSQMVNIINAAENYGIDLAQELEDLAVAYVEVPTVCVKNVLQRYGYNDVSELFQDNEEEEMFLYI